MIDLLLGADVDAAHRIVHQHHRRPRRQRPGEQHLLLVAAREREDGVGHILGAHLDALAPALRDRLLLAVPDQAHAGEVGQEGYGHVLEDAPQRQIAVDMPVAGDEGDPRVAPRQPVAALPHVEVDQRARLAMPAEPGEADDLARIGDEIDGSAAPGVGPLRQHRLDAGHVAAVPVGVAGAHHAAHRPNQAVNREFLGRPFGDDLAVLHHHHPVGGGEDFTQDVRDQHHRPAGADEAAHIGEQLASEAGIERGRRLVEDDELDLGLGLGKGGGDFHHLPLGDRERRDRPVAVYAVAWEDLVELLPDQRLGPLAPAQALERGVGDPGVFGHRQIGAERKLLEHAAHAVRMRLRDRIAGGGIGAIETDDAGIGPEAAVDDVDQRRLAGPVVADQPDALAGGDREIHTVERANGAEALFGAVHCDDCVWRSSAHELKD